jgi:hypothetical protein
MPPTIRLAETPTDRQRVYAFRYRIYVEEMGRPQIYADHGRKIVEEPLDKTGRLFLAENDKGEVVGTLRTNFARDSDLGDYETLYGMDCAGPLHPLHTSVSTKFMVSPELRRGSLGIRLASVGYSHNLREGILFDFIDCNPHLEATFTRLGYLAYRDRIVHPEYGDVLPLVLPVTDLEHLESIRSPWASICRENCPRRDANRRMRDRVEAFHRTRQIQAA